MTKIIIEQLKKGDVLLNKKHHTALYIGGGQIVHASINEKGEIIGGKEGDQTGREICTRTYYDYPWEVVLRYPDAALASEAVAFAVGIAEDPAHGYDQVNRWGPDYDCSSLVISAFEAAGVPVRAKGATYTGNMLGVFKKCGFTEVTFTEAKEKPPEAPQTAPTDDGVIYHKVVKGETLTSIARLYGVTVGGILMCNPFIKNPDKIYIGDKLTIPSSVKPTTSGGIVGKVKTVYGSPLNIRQRPTTSSAVLGQLKNGESVKVESTAGEWLKLANRPGYVYAKYISFS